MAPIRPIPTARSKEEVREALSRHAGWFYEFTFTNGAATPAPDDLTALIHRTRAELILPALDAAFTGRWPEVRCLDVACHQGWFAAQIAVRGARQVVGLDVRTSHIEMAKLIQRLADAGNLAFEQRNLFDLRGRADRYDLTLFLGILYHLDSPLEALRIVRSLTTRLCVIETQVARPTADLEAISGSDLQVQRGPAIAVMPASPYHAEGNSGVVLVPTLKALHMLVSAAGFDRHELIVAPPAAYEQYTAGDRVALLAWVEQ